MTAHMPARHHSPAAGDRDTENLNMELARSSRRGRRSGFTLIEVMLAVFVLSLTALIFAASFPISQISRIKSAHMSYAVNMARQTMEEKRAAGYNGLLIGTTTSVPADLPGSQQTTTITQYSPHIKQVVVTISWEGYRRVGGSTTLVTLVSDHG